MSFSNINIQNFIIENRLIKGDSILDIGAGHGALAYLMQRDSEYVKVNKVAIEISKEAKEFNNKHKLYEEFFTSNYEDIDVRKFDTVVALELMEHLIPNHPSLDEFLLKIESLATKRVIISVPAPYMTFNIDALKVNLKDISNKDKVSDEEAITLLADTHKQIISPSYLISKGYKGAFNFNKGTISGSIIYYKDINRSSDSKKPLAEMLYPNDFLKIAKGYYTGSEEISNRDFLIKFFDSLIQKYSKKHFTPLYPSLIYYLKVAIFNLIKRS